jgi:glutathione S-transferase
MLKLFVGTPGSISLASHIALEEAGAAYEVVYLDVAKTEQRSDAYLKINPKGRVPALLTDRGILTETPAILLYIAQSHPAATLAPLDDAFALARLQSFNAYVCSTAHPNHAHRMRGLRWTDDPAVVEALKIKVPRNMADAFTYIEGEFLNGPWVMGDHYTVADPYLYILASWMEDDEVDPAAFPRVAAHRQRMRQRPAVQRVLGSYP